MARSKMAYVAAASAMMAAVAFASAQPDDPDALGCGELLIEACGYCDPALPKVEKKECWKTSWKCIKEKSIALRKMAKCTSMRDFKKNAEADNACFEMFTQLDDVADCDEMATTAERKECYAAAAKANKDDLKEAGCWKGRGKGKGKGKGGRRGLREEEISEDFDDADAASLDHEEMLQSLPSQRRSLASWQDAWKCRRAMRRICDECREFRWGTNSFRDCEISCYADASGEDAADLEVCESQMECRVAIRDTCTECDDKRMFDGRGQCVSECVRDNYDAFEDVEGCGLKRLKEKWEEWQDTIDEKLDEFEDKVEEAKPDIEDCKTYIDDVCDCDSVDGFFARLRCLGDCAKDISDDEENPCHKAPKTIFG